MNSNGPMPQIGDLLDAEARPPRRKALRLGLMHYHLKPGGVVSVMRDIVASLSRHSHYLPLEIEVIASGSAKAANRIFGRSGGSRSGLKAIDIPSLAYREQPYPDRGSFLKAADDLAGEILDRIDLPGVTEHPYILHSHNVSLGKNPTATMAFKRIGEIAAARSLPLWLINQVHDFAENNRPEQMRAFFNCTGRHDEAFARSFMYPSGPNVIYLAINSRDTENLMRIGVPRARIFLLPDPVDVSQFERKPLWEDAQQASAAPFADYKAALIGKLADYASACGQVFNGSLPMLLSPMKVMRRKNNIESILLLLLLKQSGRRLQLLITLDANSPPDIAYSKRLKQFAAARAVPVLVGFGRGLISAAGERVMRRGVVKQFIMPDLHALSTALVTTSIMEGFGLIYHEPWLSHKVVVGRKIPEIVCDFEDNGMDFGHMYDRLSVSLSDLPNLRSRILEAYEEKLVKLSGARNRPEKLTRSTINDIMETKLFRVSGEDCIDFADISLEMQLELLGRVADEPALANRVLDRNPKIGGTSAMLAKREPGLIERNRSVVQSKYSLNAMARRLESLFDYGDSVYRMEHDSVPVTPEAHAALIRKYRKPENIRLLF